MILIHESCCNVATKKRREARVGLTSCRLLFPAAAWTTKVWWSLMIIDHVVGAVHKWRHHFWVNLCWQTPIQGGWRGGGGYVSPLSLLVRIIDDLYIIGAVCLSVCLSVCQQKSLFLYSKDLIVSHVYRHFPYSRYFVISPVYRHHILQSV